MDRVHKAYVEAYEKCLAARKKGKRYIGIQTWRHGPYGYRLIATNQQPTEGCGYYEGFSVSDWASNIMYRLVDLRFLLGKDVDRYFDELGRVGYGNNQP